MFDLKKNLKDRKNYEAEAEKKYELWLIDSQKKIPGAIVFEYNQSDNTIRKAKMDAIVNINYPKKYIDILGFEKISKLTTTIDYKVIVNKDCVYFQAMGYKNAKNYIEKKFNKTAIIQKGEPQ